MTPGTIAGVVLFQHPGIAVPNLDDFHMLHRHENIALSLEDPMEVSAIEPAQPRDGRSLEHLSEFSL
jgi:hypothetical protein